MTRIWARCISLHGLMAELTGPTGGEQVVIVSGGAPDDRPANWQVWTPWVADAPTRFVTHFVSNCQPLRRVVHALRNIRCELDALWWGSGALRDNFRTYFEEGLIKVPWLSGIRFETCREESGPGGGHSEYSEVWILETLAPPATRLELCTTMAKEVLLNEELRANEFDALGESAPLGPVGPDEGEPATPPNKGGRPPVPQVKIWKAEAKRCRDLGNSYRQVVQHLEGKFGIKRSTATVEKWVKELRKGE